MKLRMQLGLRGFLGAAVLCVTGCSSTSGSSVTQKPIDSSQATATTNARIEQILTGLADAASSLDTTSSTTIATDALVIATGSNRCGNSDSSAVNTTSDGVDSVPKSTTSALGDLVRRVRDEAKSHVFREELVESDDGRQVVYRVDPTEACNGNAECLDKLTTNPLRFAVTSNTDDSLNVALLVGQDRHNPATALLSETKVSVRGNLGEYMDAIRLYMTAEQQKNLPEKLAGVTEWSLEKRGEGDFALTSSIIERFELLTGQAKGKPVSVTMQPSSPTSQVTINSVTNTIGFRENIGTIDVSAAGTAVCNSSMNCGTQEQSGTFGLHLAGLTGEFAATAHATDLTFSNLGLGSESSYLASNGRQLTTVDVNPNAGRRFSMNFSKTAEGTLVTFEPALDLRIAMAMSNLSDSMRVDLPEWLANEVFDVTLGGAPKPSVLVPATTCDANGQPQTKEQLEVVAGSLQLKATSIPNSIDATAGMCLVPVSSSASQPHPFSLVAAGTCQ